MANEKRLIYANPLCEFFQERYEYLRNASETQLPNGNVSIDLDLQVGAIIAKEFLDKAKQAQTVDAVEVVHGLWETANDGTHFCSNCGCDATYTWDDIDRSFINSADDVPDRITNFCPHCGARMDGGMDND